MGPADRTAALTAGSRRFTGVLRPVPPTTGILRATSTHSRDASLHRSGRQTATESLLHSVGKLAVAVWFSYPGTKERHTNPTY
jgi:hypothetical protein